MSDGDSDISDLDLEGELAAIAAAEEVIIRKQLESHRGWLTRILRTSAATLQVAAEDYNKPVIRDALEKHLEKLDDQYGKIDTLLI